MTNGGIQLSDELIKQTFNQTEKTVSMYIRISERAKNLLRKIAEHEGIKLVEVVKELIESSLEDYYMEMMEEIEPIYSKIKKCQYFTRFIDTKHVSCLLKTGAIHISECARCLKQREEAKKTVFKY